METKTIVYDLDTSGGLMEVSGAEPLHGRLSGGPPNNAPDREGGAPCTYMVLCHSPALSLEPGHACALLARLCLHWGTLKFCSCCAGEWSLLLPGVSHSGWRVTVVLKEIVPSPVPYD